MTLDPSCTRMVQYVLWFYLSSVLNMVDQELLSSKYSTMNNVNVNL